MRISDIGEFGLIRRIARGSRGAEDVRIGIGDDAALLSWKGRDLLVTTDMLIEDRHFRIKEASSFEIGWKAMCVNLSDIAAMGGVPTHAVIDAGFPPDLEVSFVLGIYKGMRSAASRYGVEIVGGDTNRASKIILAVTLFGRLDGVRPLRRGGAKPGQVVMVSGRLGGSYESRKHLRFTPRLTEARFLARHYKVGAMMDLSDGLAGDAQRMAEASGVTIVLSESAIPVSAEARGARQAATDGEDFELLFTLSASEAARLAVDPRARKLAPFQPVGKVAAGGPRVRWVHPDGRLSVLSGGGFDHFR